jgi:predicted RNA-binding protein with PUA-like domain
MRAVQWAGRQLDRNPFARPSARQVPARMRYWLFKSEPEAFSIDDLAAAPKGTTPWDGVRNYQARNFMRDEMRSGDRVLFYHSSAEPPAVVGTAVVVRGAYPDPTAQDPRNPHYDPRATPDEPIWQMVDIRFEEKFAAPLPPDALRGVPALAKMELLRRGSRLSIQPVRKAEFAAILKLARAAARRETAPQNRGVSRRARRA